MKTKLLLFVTFSLFVFCNCKQTENFSNVELITADEMDSLLKLEKVQLIDIRTSAEYTESHIKGARNIDFWASNFSDLISEIDKTKPVAIYCGRGKRSRKCSAFMKKAGFKKVYDLDGGITEWKYKGKPIVK